ncbi:MAG: hypothetical protein ACRD0W_09585 [Acidimicrobiales bacterium]
MANAYDTLKVVGYLATRRGEMTAAETLDAIGVVIADWHESQSIALAEHTAAAMDRVEKAARP